MESSDHRICNPVEQPFEPQAFQSQRHCLTLPVGQSRSVNPHPQIAQDQRHSHKDQTQPWAARACIDAGLARGWRKAGFNAESFAIPLSNVASVPFTPRPQTATTCCTCLPSLRLRCVRYATQTESVTCCVLLLRACACTSHTLPFDPVQARWRTTLFGTTSAERLGIKKSNRSRFQRDHWHVEEGPIQQQTLDFQANFANTSKQTSQCDDCCLVTPHPSQRQRVPLPVLDNACRGIGMKLCGPMMRLAVIKLVPCRLGLTIIRHQMPIDRHARRRLSRRGNWPVKASFRLACSSTLSIFRQAVGRALNTA